MLKQKSPSGRRFGVFRINSEYSLTSYAGRTLRTTSLYLHYRKYPTKQSDIFYGAGTGSRTLISSLGRIHNSRYTIPAAKPIIPYAGAFYYASDYAFSGRKEDKFDSIKLRLIIQPGILKNTPYQFSARFWKNRNE